MEIRELELIDKNLKNVENSIQRFDNLRNFDNGNDETLFRKHNYHDDELMSLEEPTTSFI